MGSQPLRNMLEVRYKALLHELLHTALFHSVVTPSETR